MDLRKTDMPALSDEDRNLLVWCAEWYFQKFRKEFAAEVQAEFPAVEHLGVVADFEARLQQLIRTLTGEADGVPAAAVADGWNPLIKRVVLAYRFDKATELERLREKTSHPEVLERLDAVLHPLDRMAARRWFREATAFPAPRLSEYLDLDRVETKLGQALRPPEREYHEKFHILQAPSLFLRDLRFFRAKCALRGLSVAVAFVDIDDFKNRFNTLHGETKVDRNVLPRFMRALEAHVAFHGHAYRQGGDEYLLLLPGLSKSMAVAFLDELRRNQAALEYPDIPERTTVSIGLCVADADCPLTDRELREKANVAEAFAKQAGRNCIAAYRDGPFDPEDLYIAAPAPAAAPRLPAAKAAPPFPDPARAI
jgi:diguanylate cyclase (GGDEF)-like protein